MRVGSSRNDRSWSTRIRPASRSARPSKGSTSWPLSSPLQRRGHRVDREVPAEEVVFDRARRDGRKRARGLVRLRARCDDVDPLVVAVEDDGGAELVVRPHAPGECFRERSREGDRVAFDGDVDVEARLSEQDVPHGAADEVHPAVGAVDRGHCLEDRVQALGQGELAHRGPILPGLPAETGAILARLGHRRARFSPIRSQRVAGGALPTRVGSWAVPAGACPERTWLRGARSPRSPRARPTGAPRPRRSSAQEEPRPPAPHRRRSSPESRPGSRGRRSSSRAGRARYRLR